MKRSVWMTGITFLAVTAWVLFRGPGMDSQPDPSVAQAAAAPSAPHSPTGSLIRRTPTRSLRYAPRMSAMAGRGRFM